ncbi:hypothetical protein [Micromonospora sp. 4G55]|uniref:hypothetical protein n=1 Tax=Micromonospora sp. 4G55 TaxID=2806102 RepID=UPI001A41EAF1|nr:hypothetical protein [Micromonospora sp. 4G55]MBM0257152.1 hypothetical protein [Micromonospora sp. 4G55]
MFPTPAQAATPGTTTALLGTYGFGRAAVIGEAGKAAGAWESFSVRSGFAGDDLTITYSPRTQAYAAEMKVYNAAFDQVADPQAECQQVGTDGVEHKVWVSFRCQTGFVPSYTLFVR